MSQNKKFGLDRRLTRNDRTEINRFKKFLKELANLNLEKPETHLMNAYEVYKKIYKTK